MGKVEKELEKTYWHAREVAGVQRSDLVTYRDYEQYFLLKNEKMRLKDMNTNYLQTFQMIKGDVTLLDVPHLFNDLNGWVLAKLLENPHVAAEGESIRSAFTPERTNALSDRQIRDILKENPRNVKYFTSERLMKVEGENLTDILIKHPYGYKHYDLSKLNEGNIAEILLASPDVMFNVLDMEKLGGGNIAYVLTNRPHLADKFDLTKMKGHDIGYLLAQQPHLFDHFTELAVKMDQYDIRELLQEIRDIRQNDFENEKQYYQGLSFYRELKKKVQNG